jgi:hypothetical protein
MATISIQDDANMVRYRPLFELIEESALVNPIKKTQEQRWGRALNRWPPLRGALSTVEPDKGGLSSDGLSKASVASRSRTGLKAEFISFTQPTAPKG